MISCFLFKYQRRDTNHYLGFINNILDGFIDIIPIIESSLVKIIYYETIRAVITRILKIFIINNIVR